MEISTGAAGRQASLRGGDAKKGKGRSKFARKEKGWGSCKHTRAQWRAGILSGGTKIYKPERIGGEVVSKKKAVRSKTAQEGWAGPPFSMGDLEPLSRTLRCFEERLRLLGEDAMAQPRTDEAPDCEKINKGKHHNFSEG